DRYGSIEMNDQKVITSFNEKKFTEKGLINGGVILINTKALGSYDLPDKFSFETDFLKYRVTENQVRGFVSEGYFIDIGIPEDFKRAKAELAEFYRR
ncbi:MAG: D-mannose-1-phosphate guanyltransferase, partial [Sediminibacterium sp.]|nr:D-mannose-1-phosphate guanyltransferase [Sediminibacterium sp.]